MSKLNSICHLREALDQIEIVMGFLAAGGEENGNMSLAKYAELLNIHNFSAVVSPCIFIIIVLIIYLFILVWRLLLGTNSLFVENYFNELSH